MAARTLIAALLFGAQERMPTAMTVVRRLITVAAVGSAVLGVAGGAALAGPQRPLALLNGPSAGGVSALAGGGPSGENVRFVDRGTFWIAVLVRNESSRPLTLVAARTPEPVKSLVREIHAGFSHYTPCTGDRLCAWPSTPTSLKPLTLRPHEEAALKFNYQLVSCAHTTVSTTASGSMLVLGYRYGSGRMQEETVPLGGARLRLERPAGVECLPRPYSYIGLVGSFTTSPEHKPTPGSDGDTCKKTGSGGLVFRSREFADRGGTSFRIDIELRRYRGIGSYHTGGPALGPAAVTAIGEFGTPGPTTVFRDPNGTVTVTTAHGATLGGRLSTVFSGHRRFFRAYGAWRCTVLR
jgi:hypothetical protein